MKFKINFSIWFIVVSVAFISSCSKSFDEKVADYIRENCPEFNNKDSCIIDLENITNFEWTHMYVFESMTMPDEISEEIGFECHCDHVKDNYTRIVFTNGPQIVHESNFYALDGEVQFRQLRKSDPYTKFTKDESKFFVIKKNKSLSNEAFFDLYSTKRNYN